MTGDFETVRFGGEGQRLLFFEPRGEMRGSSVFYIHPGGWTSGSPETHAGVGRFLSGRGYPTFLTSYRLAPMHRFPAQLEDVAAGFEAMVALAGERELPCKGSVVAGWSSGAHLGALLVYGDRGLRGVKRGARDVEDMGGVEDMEGVEDVGEARDMRGVRVAMDNIKGLLSVAGVLDLDLCRGPELSRLLGQFLEGEAQREEANPVNHVRGDEGLPLLCLHGSDDDVVEVENQRSFVDRVNRGGGRGMARLEVVEGRGHFDVGGALEGGMGSDIVLDWLANL